MGRKEVMDKLGELGISYEIVEHGPVYTIEDMEKLDQSIFKGAEICKNLFLRDQKGKRHFLVVLCGEKQADLEKLQEQVEASRLSFGSAERLMKHLGLEAGHVSPMGVINNQDHKVEVVLDKDLKTKPLLAVHPNTNEASILFTFEGMLKYIESFGNEIEYVTI